jgi:hypothetical protein
MPSTSKKQRNFMAAVAHSPTFAKKVGVPQSVGKDFNEADKGRKFGGGSSMATPTTAPAIKIPSSGHSRPDLQRMNNPKTNQGANELFKKGGDTMATKGVNPFAKFEKSGKDTEAKGKGKEGSKKEEAFDKSQMGMKRGGGVKKMAEGGMADTAQDKAMIKKAFKQHDMQEHKGGKGTDLKLAKGGSFRASANGIAQRGKTKAAMPAMKKGGKC